MAKLSTGPLSCLRAQLLTFPVNGVFRRFIYRLWRTSDDGYLLDAAQMEVGKGARVVDRHGVWLADGERAQALFERVAADSDPVLPVHLIDVVRDALWEAAEDRPTAAAYGQRAGSAPA